MIFNFVVRLCKVVRWTESYTVSSALCKVTRKYEGRRDESATTDLLPSALVILNVDGDHPGEVPSGGVIVAPVCSCCVSGEVELSLRPPTRCKTLE